MSVYEIAARASAGLSDAQRDMLAQLITVAPTPIVEHPVAAADLRVIASLRARILDEMERLTTAEIAAGDLVVRLGKLCMQSLHYVLVKTGDPDAIISWVEAVLPLLAEARWITTPAAERIHFGEVRS
ncbi:MAG: hypothetical protein H0X24_01880 [Ktedonobacterales bacterium]|nr:hypothetical protein [Ktedonobacterales bacterium]